jgi:NADH-quinone oxidoreductase subunit L
MEQALTPYPGYFDAVLLLTVLLPLFSFLVSLLISDRYAWSVSLIGPFFMLISSICSLVVLFNVWDYTPYAASTIWFSTGHHAFTAGVFLNNMSALMLAVVALISFLVHLYSIGYMAGDEGEKRYFGMLGLFTFSMFGIVLADNLLLIFVFWELVGFSSYMLIGHWKEKPEAASASKKAFILNRVGDAGFLVGLMILWTTGAGFAVSETPLADETLLNTMAGICIFCGVIGKSAQFPLSNWLPDAMEGPTPVSALIHAATMVAAGVYLLARVFNIFTPDALLLIAIVGIVTALMASLSALVQNDIKKILAYSTISQLGLMITAVGAGSWEAAMLHLFTHAFFKACLFLCAGSVIHVLHHAQLQSHLHFDVQDVRNLGGLRKKLPFTFFAVLVSGSSLAGIPFFSGFISKEAILTTLYSWKGDAFNVRWIIFLLAFAVSFLTVLYIVRFAYRIFMGPETATKPLSFSEAPKIMRAPIALLAVCSLWFIISYNPLDSGGYFFPGDVPHSAGLTLFSVVWILLALGVALYLSSKDRWFQSPLLNKSFYLDDAQKYLIASPTLYLSQFTMKVDRKWIDGAIHALAYVQVTASHLAGWWDKAIVDGTVNGIATFSRLIGSFTRSFQGGKIQLYVFWSLFTIVIFLIWSLI